MGRDRNNPMGLGTNTYAAATITSHQELAGYFGPNYRVKFVSNPDGPLKMSWRLPNCIVDEYNATSNPVVKLSGEHQCFCKGLNAAVSAKS
jgi:hypothetical protein